MSVDSSFRMSFGLDGLELRVTDESGGDIMRYTESLIFSDEGACR